MTKEECKKQVEDCRKGITFQRAKYLRQSLIGDSAQKLDNTGRWIIHYKLGLQNSLAILARHQQEGTQ
jgi:hypothetical protein